MTNKSQQLRVLAIAPFYRGFGYAVLDDDGFIDWGLKTVSGEGNARRLAHVEFFMNQYAPDVLSLEDFAHTRRGPRIRTFIRDIIDLAQKHNIGVKLFSRPLLYQAFFADGEGTKEALAALLAKRFPDELGSKLPPKRRAWNSEDSRLTIFDAVALALVTLPGKPSLASKCEKANT